MKDVPVLDKTLSNIVEPLTVDETGRRYKETIEGIKERIVVAVCLAQQPMILSLKEFSAHRRTLRSVRWRYVMVCRRCDSCFWTRTTHLYYKKILDSEIVR